MYGTPFQSQNVVVTLLIQVGVEVLYMCESKESFYETVFALAVFGVLCSFPHTNDFETVVFLLFAFMYSSKVQVSSSSTVRSFLG